MLDVLMTKPYSVYGVKSSVHPTECKKKKKTSLSFLYMSIRCKKKFMQLLFGRFTRVANQTIAVVNNS